MADSAPCATCGASITAADSFLSLGGATVCRRCYYAEQTKIQARRADESARNELGIYETKWIVKRLFVGGMLLVIGGFLCFGMLAGQHWKDAALWGAVAAFGLAVIVVSVHEFRQRRR
jgi:hypothetical protein